MTTKKKILTIALELFTKQGIANTSTSQITKEVGVATGTLFFHFSTKQELVDAIFLDIKQKFKNDVQSLDLTTVSVENQVKSITKTMVEYYLRNYTEFLFLMLLEHDPQVSAKAIEKNRQEYASLNSQFSAWVKDGYIKAVDPKVLKNFVWSMICSLVKSIKQDGRKKITQLEVDMVWDALKI